MVNMRPHGFFSPSAAQLRAARAAVNLSIQELAGLTGLGVNTIRRAEASKGPLALTRANAERLVMTLESLGVHFLEADERGDGVRFKEPPA